MRTDLLILYIFYGFKWGGKGNTFFPVDKNKFQRPGGYA